MDNHLTAFLDQLNSSSTATEAWSSSCQYFESFGFDSCVYSFGQKEDNPSTPNIWAKVNTEWIKHYDDSGYIHDDPIYSMSSKTLEPIVIGSNYFTPHISNKIESQIVFEAYEAGLSEGVSLPIRTLDQNGFGSFGIYTNMSNIEFEKIYGEYNEKLLFACLSAHSQIQCLIRSEERSNTELTTRQKELLQWLAKGLQNDQIADKLGISYDGVSYLLGEIKKRLGVRTRREVLPKALKLSLISV